ncbi:MAG: S8 family serine peptidase [Deltaproteobacteria bacterium]|nr:S8 family serine peptidase [Deltaproteobacteria bacterium]
MNSLHLFAGSKRVIVKFKDVTRTDLVKQAGGIVENEFKIFRGVSAIIPDERISLLSRHPAIEYIEEDRIVYAVGKPGPQQPPQTTPWGISKINAPQSWALSTGYNANVCVVDSGIQLDHPDLVDNIGWNVTFVTGTKNGNDDNGHGTHVAGTIAAVKVLNKSGSGYTSWVIKGIEWCVANGMDVINLSLGSETYSQSEENAIKAAYNAGLVIVVAAGNDAQTGNNLQYPAIFPEVLAVAATDSANNVASFSSHGYWVDIAAPGVQIYSTAKGSTYTTKNGTSMATPHVSGGAAVLLAYNPALTNAEVYSKLTSTATDLGDAGWDEYFGWGLLDLYAAVTAP